MIATAPAFHTHERRVRTGVIELSSLRAGAAVGVAVAIATWFPPKFFYL
jgi:hypothetical protein